MCYTILLFEQNGKTYTIKRSIHFKKKQGGGFADESDTPSAVITYPDEVTNKLETLSGSTKVTEKVIGLIKLNRDHPAFMIHILHTHAISYVKRRDSGQDSGGTVPLLFGTQPELPVSLRLYIHLSGLALCLLKAENVRIQDRKTLHEPLTKTCPNPVDIPGA